MNYSFEHICKESAKLKSLYRETDPFKICGDMGIKVLFAPMGTSADSCKGFFLNQNRIKSITINSDLSPEFQRIICAHELGHCVLHKNKTGIKEFHDFGLFDSISEYEYEANIFAAEFLLDDSDVIERLNDDLSFFQAAAELCVPAEILDFKFRTMKWKGYKITDAPMYSSRTWLKSAKDGGNTDNLFNM